MWGRFWNVSKKYHDIMPSLKNHTVVIHQSLALLHTIISKADISIQDGVNFYPVCQDNTSNNSSSHDICWTMDTKIQPTEHHWYGPCKKRNVIFTNVFGPSTQWCKAVGSNTQSLVILKVIRKKSKMHNYCTYNKQ